MLSKSAAAVLVLAGTAAVHAQQAPLFLEKPALYPTNVKPSTFEDATTTTVGDVQNKCQYMAGLNFYDLQPLALAQKNQFTNVSAIDSPNKYVYISFCHTLPENLWCEDDHEGTMAVLVELDPEDDFREKSCVRLSG